MRQTLIRVAAVIFRWLSEKFRGAEEKLTPRLEFFAQSEELIPVIQQVDIAGVGEGWSFHPSLRPWSWRLIELLASLTSSGKPQTVSQPQDIVTNLYPYVRILSEECQMLAIRYINRSVLPTQVITRAAVLRKSLYYHLPMSTYEHEQLVAQLFALPAPAKYGENKDLCIILDQEAIKRRLQSVVLPRV